MNSNGQSGLWLLFVRKGKVFVPTMARTEAGYYLGIEPVAVIDCDDRGAIHSVLVDTIQRGNPVIPTPSRSNFPRDPLLKYANVKSISTFEQTAQCWKVGRYANEYVIAPYRPSSSGGSQEDNSSRESLPLDQPIQSIVQRLMDKALGANTPA